ncbi:hypothetical protein [Pseudonocardia alaniniphila]|uniref:DDE superfamily endonuclease n=1 Tax=Pseudonocardia alaniniphila TaxID=75291 RepID=A0ABS9TUH1_9PSEU|nr:hypothetical protein [Pseudonocardia alaniniphila]MCH6172218.1 hypothetical protein [Pseudonocardia alaniniphila]
MRDRKRWTEFLGFCRPLRRRFPSGRRYLVCDNDGAHQKAGVLARRPDHGIELVRTPSNASWLNWIECESLGYFTTLGPGCGGSSAGVAIRPLDPAVEVPGRLLVTPAERPASALVAAFT